MKEENCFLGPSIGSILSEREYWELRQYNARAFGKIFKISTDVLGRDRGLMEEIDYLF